MNKKDQLELVEPSEEMKESYIKKISRKIAYLCLKAEV